jgi:long-subunit acyl-CoA synthetase (AMP-forming)
MRYEVGATPEGAEPGEVVSGRRWVGSEAIEAERASIEREGAGLTLCDLLARNADQRGERPALSWETGGGWETLTWRGYREQVARLALGLRELGVGRGDFVAIMARNRPEHAITDLAVIHAGATPVSIYNTLAPEQIAHVAGNCGAEVAIVEDVAFMERWQQVKPDLPALEHIVLLVDADSFAGLSWVHDWADVIARGRDALEVGRHGFEAMWREVRPDDMATLVYTSATTGPPKGVAITHRNIIFMTASFARVTDVPTGYSAVSYLPLAHAAERMNTLYFPLWKAGHVHFCPDQQRLFDVVPQVRPDVLGAVPRVWEKLEAAIGAALAAEANPRKAKIARRAIEAGRRTVRHEQAGQPPPAALRLQRILFERLVYRKIRKRVGLDRVGVAMTGGAPTPPSVMEFFFTIGLPITEIYGMSECTFLATMNEPGRGRIGQVGRAMPGIELRLAADGELLVRGGNVAAGYHDDPAKTAETFEADGWLHTGDVAAIDADGSVRIVDRKKELIITAAGKNISPANLEALLVAHPLVGQACAIGDRRPYVSVLIVLDGEAAPVWARANGVPFSTIADFSREPRAIAEIQRAVDEANEHVSQVEEIKRFAVLPSEWTVETDELTPTLKLKRRVIMRRYAREIEELYSGGGADRRHG